MAEQEKPLTIHDYLEKALRHKWYISIPLVCSVLISFGVYKYLPKIYRSTTLILVQPQRVPENYVRATITDSVAGRLNTISQEILSRTKLEKVIKELDLYSELLNKRPMEEIVDSMRARIDIRVQGRSQNERDANSFTVSFEGPEPRTVMTVTNRLASLFIEENLKVRELQAGGTSEFISREVAQMEDQLKKNEEEIRRYKERNMGQLPQQLDANLRILERLQEQFKTTSETLRAAEDRGVLIQNQIERIKGREPIRTAQTRTNPSTGEEEPDTNPLPEDPLVTQLNTLKRDLSNAQTKYTESHPDIIDLKRKIAAIEPKVEELKQKQNAQKEARLRKLRERVSTESLPDPALDRFDSETRVLLVQYTDQYNALLLDAKRSRDELKRLGEQINSYRARIEDTPRKEQELTLLTRDYDLLRANYQSLLDKKIQAQMAQNMEMKQQGEQFKILDPARLPEKPIKPDRNRILLMGTFFGLAIGVGLAWFRDFLDKSLRTVSEVEDFLGFPVLATIPNLKADKEAA